MWRIANLSKEDGALAGMWTPRRGPVIRDMPRAMNRSPPNGEVCHLNRQVLQGGRFPAKPDQVGLYPDALPLPRPQIRSTITAPISPAPSQKPPFRASDR